MTRRHDPPGRENPQRTPISNPPLHHPPAHEPPPFAARVVAYAHHSLDFAGTLVYDEGPKRSLLFHRKPGNFAGAHADCSQYCATILHWCGVKTVNDRDYTGTLLLKGRATVCAPARVVIFGPGTGTHAALITERAGKGDWWTIGFGHQGAPNRVRLSAMVAYFKQHGHSGVRYLDFTPRP